MKCAYCFSPDVKQIASYETRDVVLVRCNVCGRVSEMDVENSNGPMAHAPRKGRPERAATEGPTPGV